MNRCKLGQECINRLENRCSTHQWVRDHGDLYSFLIVFAILIPICYVLAISIIEANASYFAQLEMLPCEKVWETYLNTEDYKQSTLQYYLARCE